MRHTVLLEAEAIVSNGHRRDTKDAPPRHVCALDRAIQRRLGMGQRRPSCPVRGRAPATRVPRLCGRARAGGGACHVDRVCRVHFHRLDDLLLAATWVCLVANAVIVIAKVTARSRCRSAPAVEQRRQEPREAGVGEEETVEVVTTAPPDLRVLVWGLIARLAGPLGHDEDRHRQR